MNLVCVLDDWLRIVGTPAERGAEGSTPKLGREDWERQTYAAKSQDALETVSGLSALVAVQHQSLRAWLWRHCPTEAR